MMNYEQIKRLNDRSRLFNGPMKAIFIKEMAGEDEPYLTYRQVNTKSKGDYRLSIMSFATKLVTMEVYAVNIESVAEFFDCYDLVGAELSIKASYSESLGLLSVYAFDALIVSFHPYELMEVDAVESLTQRVVGACEKNRIPLGNHGKDMIECELKRCIDEEINAIRPFRIEEYSILKWIQKDEDLFTLD